MVTLKRAERLAAFLSFDPMQPINYQVKAAIVSRLNDWKFDKTVNASDVLISIAEMMRDTGANIDMAAFYARREG
jgi:hypothetical protein